MDPTEHLITRKLAFSGVSEKNERLGFNKDFMSTIHLDAIPITENSKSPNFISPELAKLLTSTKKKYGEIPFRKRNVLRNDNNPYEDLKKFSSNRAGIKIMNIDSIFNLIKQQPNFTFCDIAGAPGAFTEYVLERTQNIGWKDSQGWGISLIEGDHLPWKINSKNIRNIDQRFNIISGSDGTGDITNPSNIRYLRVVIMLKTNDNGIDFASADGSMNPEGREEEHEVMMHKLLFGEILAAIHILKRGGSFILKVFDLHTKFSVDLMYFLKIHFSMISIFKPVSSRPANSERYVVCKNFLGLKYDSKLLYSIIEKKNMTSLYNTKNMDPGFLEYVQTINDYSAIFQLDFLMRTIEDIQYSNEKSLDLSKTNQIWNAFGYKPNMRIALNIDYIHIEKLHFVNTVFTDFIISSIPKVFPQWKTYKVIIRTAILNFIRESYIENKSILSDFIIPEINNINSEKNPDIMSNVESIILSPARELLQSFRETKPSVTVFTFKLNGDQFIFSNGTEKYNPSYNDIINIITRSELKQLSGLTNGPALKMMLKSKNFINRCGYHLRYKSMVGFTDSSEKHSLSKVYDIELDVVTDKTHSSSRNYMSYGTDIDSKGNFFSVPLSFFSNYKRIICNVPDVPYFTSKIYERVHDILEKHNTKDMYFIIISNNSIFSKTKLKHFKKSCGVYVIMTKNSTFVNRDMYKPFVKSITDHTFGSSINAYTPYKYNTTKKDNYQALVKHISQLYNVRDVNDNWIYMTEIMSTGLFHMNEYQILSDDIGFISSVYNRTSKRTKIGWRLLTSSDSTEKGRNVINTSTYSGIIERYIHNFSIISTDLEFAKIVYHLTYLQENGTILIKMNKNNINMDVLYYLSQHFKSMKKIIPYTSIDYIFFVGLGFNKDVKNINVDPKMMIKFANIPTEFIEQVQSSNPKPNKTSIKRFLISYNVDKTS
jgi:23S rRNA U2552 (ribose-2'-O)-methylase RlmE/FtsJ